LQQQQHQQGVRSALAAVADTIGLPADGLDEVADDLLHDAPHAPSAEEQQLQQLDAALAQLRSLDLDESTTLDDDGHVVAGLAAAAAVPADADNEMGNACGNGKEEVMQDVVAAAAAADNDDEEDDNNSNDSDDCDRDARGRKRIARAPLYWSKKRLAEALDAAADSVAHALDKLAPTLQALGSNVPWRDPDEFERLCDEPAPRLFHWAVRVLTPHRPTLEAENRARQLAPVLLLDMLGKRSQKFTALKLLRAQLLRHAGASDLAVCGLHQLGELPSIRSVIAHAARRRLQHPEVVDEWVRTNSDAALCLLVDDFHVIATSRAPARAGSTSAAHAFVTSLGVALSAGSAAGAAHDPAAPAVSPLLPSPIVDIDAPTLCATQRRRAAEGARAAHVAHATVR
jgi:hypothetical protein